MTTRSVRSLLGEDELIRPLIQRASLLVELQRLFTEAVPKTLSVRSRVASLESDKLVIIASSPAIAAKLRQLTPFLLLQLQTSVTKVNGIHIQVQVGGSFPHTAPAGRPRTPPGPQAVRNLQDLAESLAPSPLRDAVTAFAQRMRAASER